MLLVTIWRGCKCFWRWKCMPYFPAHTFCYRCCFSRRSVIPEFTCYLSLFDMANWQPVSLVLSCLFVLECPDFDVHLSPKKALRVAMLKSRYAETILKAQEKTLLDHVRFFWTNSWSCEIWFLLLKRKKIRCQIRTISLFNILYPVLLCFYSCSYMLLSCLLLG